MVQKNVKQTPVICCSSNILNDLTNTNTRLKPLEVAEKQAYIINTLSNLLKKSIKNRKQYIDTMAQLIINAQTAEQQNSSIEMALQNIANKKLTQQVKDSILRVIQNPQNNLFQ